MKKFILIGLVIIFAGSLSLFSLAAYISFTRIRPTIDNINKKMETEVLSKIIRIPQGIERPSLEFDKNSYFWEMETNAGEVSGVRFSYTPSFNKTNREIIATLEMPDSGDPSIFEKVLPAVISDEQSLKSATDPLKANLGKSDSAYFSQIQLAVNKNKQTTKMVWTIPKENLPDQIKNEYNKLNYPMLKTLYGIPNFLIGLFKG